MPNLLIKVGRRRKVFQILDPEFTVGSAEGNALRIQSDAVEERHLRFVQVDARLRVEPLGGDAARVLVNGEPMAGRVLAHGDRVAVGPVELVFWDDGMPRPAEDDDAAPAEEDAGEPGGTRRGLNLRIESIPTAPKPRAPQEEPVVRRSGRRGRRAPSELEAPRRAPRRRGMPRALIWWNAALVATVVGFLVYRHFASQTSVRSSEDLILLATSQRAAGAHDRAMATLDLALENATDPEARARIRDLQEQIRDELELRADLPILDRAVLGVDHIRRFVKMYLADEPDSRPAARELLRMTAEWLDEFRAVCQRHDHERALIDEVEDYARRYRAVAQPDTPDTAEDALFAAGRRARFTPRRYPEAIRILEGWLEGAAADASQRSEVERRLQEYRERGPQYVEERRAAIERMVEWGQIDRAIHELRDLVEKGALPEWLGDERERLRQLEERR